MHTAGSTKARCETCGSTGPLEALAPGEPANLCGRCHKQALADGWKAEVEGIRQEGLAQLAAMGILPKEEEARP